MENDISKLKVKDLAKWVFELESEVKLIKFNAKRARMEVIGIAITLGCAIFTLAWIAI